MRMRDLADIHYPHADQSRIVMDDLSTHTAGALYEAFPAPEAHRILRRLEFHYTAKHASWLNMVRSRSACCAGSVWIGALVSARPSIVKSWHGSASAMRPARASNGSSRRRRRARSWPASIQTPPKSRNHCDGGTSAKAAPTRQLHLQGPCTAADRGLHRLLQCHDGKAIPMDLEGQAIGSVRDPTALEIPVRCTSRKRPEPGIMGSPS